jgi:hypothetical protein
VSDGTLGLGVAFTINVVADIRQTGLIAVLAGKGHDPLCGQVQKNEFTVGHALVESGLQIRRQRVN